MKHEARYPLLFNPRARSQRGARTMRFLLENATRFYFCATRSPEEAKEFAAKFAAEGEPIVVAAGGDGTLNAVVAGLANSETALGVLPAGTMNVFARELGIPFHHLQGAFDVIERGWIREVDLFEVNGSPFVQMAGIGFDAMVIEETTWESKKMLGPLAYLLSAVKVLGANPPLLKITDAEGKVTEGVAVLVGNGSLYGGQFRLFHKADNLDSKMDVLVFQVAGYRMLLDSLKGLTQGGIDLAGAATYFQTPSLRVEAEEDVPLQVDGELLGRAREMNFAASRSRLRVVAPEEPIQSRFAQVLQSMIPWMRKAEG